MPNEHLAAVRGRLQVLVKTFRENYAQYQRATYNETQVRVDFVNPLFQLLGWDIMNEAGLPQHLREVIHEATVLVEENGTHRSKKPDYSFRVGTETLFFLETKKPFVNIAADRSPAFQLRRYGWSGNLKVSVLTNFTDLYIYDCTIRPIEGDEIGTALIAHYHYTEYEEKFDEIYSLLSKESALNGEFQRIFSNVHGAIRHEPFDAYFLEQIRGWRMQLGTDIVKNNPAIDTETLNIFVQKILNRSIFLRICEDKNLEKYESLKKVTTYNELKHLFSVADQKYDSGLFEMLDEDRFVISDTVIIEIFQSLYYPNNSYEFGVVDPYIIGQIYELFLDESLAILADGQVISVQKPEVVDAQGTVNTPKNITDIIVSEVLGALYEEKTLEEVARYRIADICCGSGNFLLSAFEYVVNYHIEYLRQNGLEEALQSGKLYQLPGTQKLFLSYDQKRTILKNLIYGVDIDPLAIEVTKFSLLLKVLEDSSAEELDDYHAKTHNRILPNLDENIKLGNSLVDSKYAHYNHAVYQNLQLMNKLRMFDWNCEFAGGKFDAIIGNPPYIRVQNMVHYSPEEYTFYKSSQSGYVTANAETLDKYYLFIERAVSLLRDNGVMGYIVPHKFMNIKSGEELRDLLSSHGYVRKIIHFGTHQVFRNRSTYTCILIMSKHPNAEFKIGFVQDLNHFLFEHDVDYTTYDTHYLSRQPWAFLPQTLLAQLKKTEPHCEPLSSLADIFVGVQTSADNIYIIHAEREDHSFVYGHERNGTEIKIEKDILRKSVYDAKLTSYEKIEANSYIIFPYKEVDGKPKLYDIEEMEDCFPNALEYLNRHKEALNKRNMPNRTDLNWYAFGRSQSLKRFMSGKHLIWPVLSLSSNYVYDDEMVVFTGGGNGPFYGLQMKQSARESIFYVQAILNHWLMELLVKSKASTFRGDYYSHGKQFVAALPIYRVNFDNPIEVQKHDDIVRCVETIMQLKEQVKRARNITERTVLERSASTVNHELNTLIDTLYQVDAQENEGGE